mgnify:CR=1
IIINYIRKKIKNKYLNRSIFSD